MDCGPSREKASYVQPGEEGSLRLFNLSPDTKSAGMSLNGKKLGAQRRI